MDGVSIFFVLSGFLIGDILLKTLGSKYLSTKSLIYFWVRRWFRTITNYLFVLVLLIVLNSCFTNHFSVWVIKKYFLFCQNLFYCHPGFFPDAWSLSIEEWFYLIIPFCLFLCILILKASVKSSVLFTAITMILVVSLFRYLRFNHIGATSFSYWDLNYRKQVVTRLDSIMYGLLGAYLQYYYKAFWLHYKSILFFCGVMILMISKMMFSKYHFNGTVYNCVFSFSVNSIATLFLLPYLSTIHKATGLWFRIVSTISIISYSMYLLNLSVVQYWIIKKIHWSGFVSNEIAAAYIQYFLYWITTILLSILLYKYFELPTTKFRDSPIIKRWLKQ